MQMKQKGFSLVEMMISIVIGLIVSAAVVASFLTTFRSNSDNMRMIRLTQELRASMDLITRELRLAGGWYRANNNIGANNPFKANIYVHTGSHPYTGNGVPVTNAPVTGTCITFTYDSDGDTSLVPGTTDRFGFRFNSTAGSSAIEYSSNTQVPPGGCGNSASWQPITFMDDNKITNLTFTVSPNLPGSDSTFYDIEITITGITNLRGDNTAITEADVDNFNVIKRSLAKTVRVRNG